MIRVTGFVWVPPFAVGLVRELRVRWALEEAGLPYEMRLIDQDDQKSAAYRKQQPFGQVPVYEEDGLTLFESGAIVLHVGEKSEALLPKDPAGKARATAWVLAALNSIEPRVQHYAVLDVFYPDQNWARERAPSARAEAEVRLADLAKWLEGRDYLEDRFTAGDLMMTTVLRTLRGTGIVEGMPALAAYQARCEARPAFRKALADHMAVYEKAA
jgi:glutathione S-transferase